jgi:hypothetical protein
MDAIFVLLAVSAIVGVVLGRYFSRRPILGSASILAIVSSTVLQHQGFGFFGGIGIIVVCLSLNQIAYLIGARLMHRGRKERHASADS